MRSFSAVPKVLLPLGGKPLLEHQLEWLKKSGFSGVFLCLGHRAPAVREFLGDGSRWGLRLEYRVEDAPRGTAGAVKDLGADFGDDLLVVYGDLYVDMDCGKLLDFHAAHDAAATVVVRETDHPEDSDLVEADADGRISAVGRLSGGRVSGNLGCAAVWVVRRRLLRGVPKTGLCDFARDVFPVAAAGGGLMAYRTEEAVLDVGTPERYEAFRRRYESA